MDIRQVTETIAMIEEQTSISEPLPWGFPFGLYRSRYQ